ncbi:MAG: ClpXP protease specificity-enhancing factor [Gammaproteobacteria bacterium]|nr:ClpXP protease specificity-enhancing factor [Gammaproteobacteria bacterium]
MVVSDSIPQRPYLLRAMHEWMSDTGLTPHILVDALLSDVQVPQQHVENGKIVLNVSYSATHGLELGNDQITFEARFAGVPHRVIVPISAVLGIYARESGEGLIFSEQDGLVAKDQSPEPELSPAAENRDTERETQSKSASDHPHLRIIK